MPDADPPWQAIGTAPAGDPSARCDIRAEQIVGTGSRRRSRARHFLDCRPIATRASRWSRHGEIVRWSGVPADHRPTHWRPSAPTVEPAADR